MPVRLTGNPREASLQLIEHMRQNGAWPDEDPCTVCILAQVLEEFDVISRETAAQICSLFADRLRGE